MKQKLRLFGAGLGLALATFAGCQHGLLLDEGNAFECEPTADRTPEVQAALCPPEWVCGIHKRCQPYPINERDILPLDGNTTQFFGAQTARVFPVKGMLDAPYTDVASISANEGAAVMAVRSNLLDAGVVFVVTGAQVTSRPIEAMELLDLAAYQDDVAAIVVETGPLRRRLKLYTTGAQRGVPVVNAGGGLNPLNDAWALRGAADKVDGGIHLYVQRQPTSGTRVNAGEVDLTVAPAEFTEFQIDAGTGVTVVALDARPIPRTQFEDSQAGADRLVPLALATDGFYYRRRRAIGPFPELWVKLTTGAEQPLALRPASVVSDPPKLRADPTQSVFAISFSAENPKRSGGADLLAHNALSVWRLARGAQSAEMTRAFGDCSPCGANGDVITVAPTFENGVIAVDVVCDVEVDSNNKATRFVRVTGSAGTDVTDACSSAPFTPSIDPREIVPTPRAIPGRGLIRRYPISDFLGNGLVIGGAHGQLWRGQSFSSMRPVFLDRAPRDVTSLGGKPFALTASYAASFTDAGVSVLPQNAFSARAGELLLPRSVPSDPTTQAAGWVVMNTSDLAKMTPTSNGFDLQFGAALLSPAGEPAREPYFVEGVEYDQEKRFVIGAFDSLYLSPRTPLTKSPGELQPLSPVLTIQPGTTLRSFVMDRSTRRTFASGNDGFPLAYGYAVVGSNLYRVTNHRVGVSEQWDATQIDLGIGEPVKVFMRADPDPQAFGRVAMRDGFIYSLPLLLPLVGAAVTSPALPPYISASDLTGRSVDFANIAELPVLLTEEGLWSPTPGNSGRYQWQLHPLPDELLEFSGDAGRPNREQLRTAKLFVNREGGDEVLYLFTHVGFVYKLAKGPTLQP